MSVLFHSARRIDARGEVADAWVLIDGARIAAVGSGADAPGADERIDLAGARLVPGFIDLHGHGGGGHAFEDLGDDLTAALSTHRAHGTTRSVVSLVANPLPVLREQLAAIADLAERDPLVLGAHLEGPFLSPQRAGAHDPAFLHTPHPGDVEALLDAARGALRVVTVAPELPGGLDAISRFAAAGAVAAVGHTEADAARTAAAFDAGARILTHAFNAMHGIHHRAPGPVPTAVADARVTLELILDGEHVAPDVARMLLRSAHGRVALITDAMAAAGATDGEYRLGGLHVVVREGRAVVAGGDTIAGSTLTQDAALRRALELGTAPAEAVAALTLVPARALGLDRRLGLLEPGWAADLVALDEEWRVTGVWAEGARLR
ncbi:MAG: N-acetylglucosamine-6-phosphate deacetylase [Micrococcales bacterium]|nr:N-acetylglucosamine-6-phosphate deacetylase [Micrococcales bacterium]